MSIESISEGTGLKNVSNSRVDKNNAVSGEKTRAKKSGATKDRVELSKKGRMMKARDDFIREAINMLDDLPEEDVREGVIERVRQRLEDGYYDQDNVMAEVIRSMQEALL